MRLLYRMGLMTQALFYVAAGLNHFWHTAMYVAIMPPHYVHPVGLVQISGVAEVLWVVLVCWCHGHDDSPRGALW